MNYEELVSHLLRQCEVLEVQCVNACGAHFPRSAWEPHFDQDCPRVRQVCEKCDASLLRPDIVSHDCIKYMKARNKELQE